MKIVILGHREIYSNIALGLLVEALAGHELSLLLSESPAVEGGPFAELDRIERSWCADLARRSPPTAPFLDFERLAQRTGRPLGTLERPNAAESLRMLGELRPDLLISVRYRKILKDAAISIPRHGVLNLHSGLLPQYRGTMATFWAMLEGETEIGSTLHYIVDGTIDTGPMVGRAPMPLSYDQSYAANVLALYPAGCRLVSRAVAAIDRDGRAPSSPQCGAGRYYSYPGAADFERFLARGLRLADGADLASFIAAQRPLPDLPDRHP